MLIHNDLRIILFFSKVGLIYIEIELFRLKMSQKIPTSIVSTVLALFKRF